MIIKLGEKALLTFFLFAIVALILWLTLGLGRVARLVPLAVVIPTLGLLAFQLMLDLVPGLAQKYSRLEKKDLFSVEPLREKSRRRAAGEETAAASLRRGRELNAFLWLALMFALVYLFGFLMALPVYAFLHLKKRSEESWLLSMAVAAGMFGLVYGIFIFLLRVGLYEGQLIGWLGL